MIATMLRTNNIVRVSEENTERRNTLLDHCSDRSRLQQSLSHLPTSPLSRQVGGNPTHHDQPRRPHGGRRDTGQVVTRWEYVTLDTKNFVKKNTIGDTTSGPLVDS